jgi:predicted TIM-barrel fold metal-dependent hydrolase
VAPRSALERLHRALGVERALIVQSMCHGDDHAVLLEALAAGHGRYRGVALVSPATPKDELYRLADAGVCGTRVHFAPHVGGAPNLSELAAYASLAAELGWHLEVHVVGDALLAVAPALRGLGVPTVIDHLARPRAGTAAGEAVVEALLSLVETGEVWVKLSAWYRLGEEAPWPFASELSAALLEAAPTRALWGTDFPHPNITGAAPDDALLLDALLAIVPSQAGQQALFVENPTELFGFA